MKPLVFLGCNTAIQLLVDAAKRQGLIVAGIVDSDYWGNTEMYADLPVIGSEKDFDDPIKLAKWKEDYDFFIGTNWSPDPAHDRDRSKRKYLIETVERVGIRCINLIDPETYIGTNVEIGDGVFIGYLAYIEFGAKIKSFSQIHYSAGIGHLCSVGKNTIIQRKCGLANCTVGDDAYIGTWSHIFTSSQHTSIGDGAVLNQGLWVARDVAAGEWIRLTRDAIRTYRNITEV